MVALTILSHLITGPLASVNGKKGEEEERMRRQRRKRRKERSQRANV